MKGKIMNAIAVQADTMIEDIGFGFGQFSLGTVLVAASDKGVAAILMGDDQTALTRELTSAFPGARLADQAGLEDMTAKVVAFLDAPHKGLELPLDIRGNALEQAIWQALRAVPSGETITYGQIAKALPVPATAQEVGAACAANVLAVAIPCHRVVKADGSISGYRWGVQRKRNLINREAAA
ncbi:methylated-DNA--[protein]-cysteine S-methyltransferase [Allomesorhizobium alhagi]|nr:methylated-DNA--[protein]-cysteine S-methyltransferase [Mesorhizobium alhagi]